MLAETLIRVPQYGTVSLLELVWTVSGVGLMVLIFVNFKDLLDEIGVRPGLRGAKERHASLVIVHSYYRREFLRLFKSFIITGIGIVADVAPNLSHYTNATGLVVTVGLFSLSALVGLQSVLDRIDRKRVSQIIEGQDAAQYGRRWNDKRKIKEEKRDGIS